MVAFALLSIGSVVWLIVGPLMFVEGAMTAYGIGPAPGHPASASATFTWTSRLGAGVEWSGGESDCP
ncbi:hypothetical protein OHS18_39275 [Amycolatopsis sp. NBC_00355]|uniref:hypothetical protein n=1 Tax=Amycolatopsis sp. NBC_00355 TaxID=2975957 RepID=UPI002E25CFBD